MNRFIFFLICLHHAALVDAASPPIPIFGDVTDKMIPLSNPMLGHNNPNNDPAIEASIPSKVREYSDIQLFDNRLYLAYGTSNNTVLKSIISVDPMNGSVFNEANGLNVEEWERLGVSGNRLFMLEGDPFPIKRQDGPVFCRLFSRTIEERTWHATEIRTGGAVPVAAIAHCRDFAIVGTRICTVDGLDSSLAEPRLLIGSTESGGSDYSKPMVADSRSKALATGFHAFALNGSLYHALRWTLDESNAFLIRLSEREGVLEWQIKRASARGFLPESTLSSMKPGEILFIEQAVEIPTAPEPTLLFVTRGESSSRRGVYFATDLETGEARLIPLYAGEQKSTYDRPRILYQGGREIHVCFIEQNADGISNRDRVHVHRCDDIDQLGDPKSWSYLYTFSKPGLMPAFVWGGKTMELANGKYLHPENYRAKANNDDTAGTIWAFSPH